MDNKHRIEASHPRLWETSCSVTSITVKRPQTIIIMWAARRFSCCAPTAWNSFIWMHCRQFHYSFRSQLKTYVRETFVAGPLSAPLISSPSLSRVINSLLTYLLTYVDCSSSVKCMRCGSVMQGERRKWDETRERERERDCRLITRRPYKRNDARRRAIYGRR